MDILFCDPLNPSPDLFQQSSGFSSPQRLNYILDILDELDPDICYLDRLRIGAVLYNESRGSEFGLAVWDDWCRRGNKYWGESQTVYKWITFNCNHPRPAKLATLIAIHQSWLASIDAFSIEEVRS